MKNHVWIIESKGADGTWRPSLSFFGRGVYATRKLAREEKRRIDRQPLIIQRRVKKYQVV